MKIIPKLQGGGFASLFTEYKPIIGQRSAPSSTKESSTKTQTKEEGINFDEKLFNLIDEIEGLPSDMAEVLSDIQNLFLLPQDADTIAAAYANSMFKIKTAKFNKEQFTETQKEVVKNGGLNEVAVTSSGEIVVQNKENGQLVQLSLEEFAKDNQYYIPLTNNQLLKYRSEFPQFANNNSLLDIVSNGIGISEIDKLMRARVEKLGQTTYPSSSESQAIQGLEILQQLEGKTPKQAQSQGVITKDQRKQAEAALSYIYNTLPENAKTVLAIHSGNISNPREATINTIQQLLTSMMSLDIDAPDTPTSSPSSSSSSSSTDPYKDLKLNNPARWQAGMGVKETFVLNIGTNDYVISNSNIMPITNNESKNIGPNSSLQQAAEGEYNGILDWGNVSIGMNIIDPSAFKSVILTDGKIASIDYPAIRQNGRIVPDLSKTTRESMDKANKEIKNLGIDLNNSKSIVNNYQTINQIYSKYGLQAAYDASGNLSGGWARFGVINSYVNEKLIKQNTNLVQEVTDDTIADSIGQQMEENDSIYKGTLWIPVTEDYNAALSGTDIKVNHAVFLDYAQQVAHQNTLQQQYRNNTIKLN